MVVNLNLNTQNLGTLYTDPTIGDNLGGSANLATQNELGPYNPTDSISLSAMAQAYLDGQPAPEQVPETVEVTAWRKLSSEAGIDNSLMSDYDFQNLLNRVAGQQEFASLEGKPKEPPPFKPGEIPKGFTPVKDDGKFMKGPDGKIHFTPAYEAWLKDVKDNGHYFDWTQFSLDLAGIALAAVGGAGMALKAKDFILIYLGLGVAGGQIIHDNQ